MSYAAPYHATVSFDAFPLKPVYRTTKTGERDRRYHKPVAYDVCGRRCSLFNETTGDILFDNEESMLAFKAVAIRQSRCGSPSKGFRIYENPGYKGHASYNPNWIGRNSFGQIGGDREIWPTFDATIADYDKRLAFPDRRPADFAFWLGEAA